MTIEDMFERLKQNVDTEILIDDFSIYLTNYTHPSEIDKFADTVTDSVYENGILNNEKLLDAMFKYFNEYAEGFTLICIRNYNIMI